MAKLTQERLKEQLHYDPETGIFTWKINRGKAKIGNIAGTTTPVGYRLITVYQKIYYAHRLAWLYVYGYFPENSIDHIDNKRNHNWISNLREVSNQCNIRNTGNSINNTSGVKGIYWNTRDQMWYAVIKIDGKLKHVGCFKDLEDAICIRLAAEQCLDWNRCDSNSPAFCYVKKHINPNAK